MCLYPRLIKNRKYTVNKKNGGNVPEMKDPRTAYVPVGCQKCIECKKQKGRQWSIRLQEEIRTNKNGKFVTLTFSNEAIRELYLDIYKNISANITGYDLDNEIATIAVRRFLERWRKKYKISIKHWLITELGHNGTENIHLHGILFTNNYKHNTPGIKEQYEREQVKDIVEIWGYGYVFIGTYVNDATINYTIKYATKMDADHKEYNAKILTSPGIGSNYVNRTDAKLNKYKPKNTDETYTTRQGTKTNLPIYYRNKIYTEEEKEKLWLEKLDQEIRYVMGSKISTKNNLEEYYLALKTAQEKNKRLGYGDGTKDWNRINYENDRRKINIQKRLDNQRENDNFEA